jgi:hypothetical protein
MQIGFITKVVLLSVVLSMLIKYGGPLLPVEPTSLNALFCISLPPIIMVIILWVRSQQKEA